ncbi:hypothetical protein [Burkholderia vietnamiensis]|uniref:hypothetical protein n=1 Tax=Burkholderia vietnamiensis TaxID=60552 RepID=UPI0007553861|nr:hypothetical protein [Burkholderia vietnamiensis]KVE67006.1 hypothetical protein WI97_11310 [Burkholderia vietnamiensis]KVE71439.1 hypothetical protein WI98_25350 [Burkholderia vietnamiensis]HDR9148903.1 hypothetical protein [Burkholderia vietnamiensis]
MLTYNDELLKARIDALETAVFEIARHEPDVLKKIHAILRMKYNLAVEQQNAASQPAGFQTVVHTNFPPARNKEAEAAQVQALGDLLKNLGAN